MTEPEIIHPFDLYEILYALPEGEFADILRTPNAQETIVIQGKSYAQSTAAPMKTHQFDHLLKDRR